MRFTPRVALLLAFVAMEGCGGNAPPPSAHAPANATVEAPAESGGVYGDPALPVAGRVLGTVIHTQDAEELRYVVLKELTDRYAASHDITVAQAEKEKYVAHVREALSKDPATAAEFEQETAEDRAARLEIAEAFIKQWKIDRALYRQYGGRIGFQQGGPEPVEAYRAFLEECQAAGDFGIEDEALAAEFWRYYRDDSMHSFFEPGSDSEKQAFSREPWAS